MTYGKEKVLNRELLVGIFLYFVGTSATTLMTMHGSKVLVKRASLRVFQRMVTLLAGKITQRVLKQILSKWFPVVGAAAIAIWTYFLTVQIGNKAIEIFERDIEYTDEEAEMPDPEGD